jgi:exonuclease III
MENGENSLQIRLQETFWILVEKVIRRRKHYETFCLQEIKLADSLDAEGRD